MHYVKQFNINGVDTKQIACIELHGVPNAATEGAVGVLGMDISSPTHEVYKCVAVNGSVYTWELLSAGMSIMSATETGEGALVKVFPYTSLRFPKGYLIKRGDLILDSEGYLYRVTAIGAESCDTEYCGTHIGGMASGDKDYTLSVVDGKLQLVTESGNVVGEIDTLLADGETIYRNPTTGRAYVMGAITVNDAVVRFFKGTRAEYNALTSEQKDGLFAYFTDESIVKLYYNHYLSEPPLCELWLNSLYFVVVRDIVSGTVITSFTLPVGESTDVEWRSSVGSGKELYSLYRGLYKKWGSANRFLLERVDMRSETAFDDFTATGWEVTFVKIGDYPV